MELHSKEESILNVAGAPMCGHKDFPYLWVNRNYFILDIIY